MKEISAVTLAAKAFPASFTQSSQTSKAGTASAAFDSFLNVGASSNKAATPQVKSDAVEQKTSETSPTTAVYDTKQTVKDDAVSTDTADDVKAPTTDEIATDDTATEEDVSNFEKVITALNQTIRDIVKDVTGVDEEMLSNALSALGLTETDLLDTSNLAKLVLFLNGSSDMTDLLANEYLMSQFNDISDAFKDIDWEALTGMKKEDFMSLLESTADMQLDANQTDSRAAVTVEYVEEDSDLIPVAKENGKDVSLNQTDENSSDLDAGLASGKRGAVNAQSGAEQTGSFEQGDSQSGSTLTQSTQTATRTPVHNEVLNGTAGFLNNLGQAMADAVGEATSQQTSMQQMIDIVNQVVEQIKVTLGRETTSMQMQLNPESLGKVLISVSSRHGVMTANFTVQTEEAKEALQNQMYSLREALESRSLKVDAVEVEVSDFAFSQSNQADAQNQKEFEKGNGRRFKFDFEDSSDEDGAVGAARGQSKPRKLDLGSSIDFTA